MCLNNGRGVDSCSPLCDRNPSRHNYMAERCTTLHSIFHPPELHSFCLQEPSTADFGVLRYGQQAVCDIVLCNVGSVRFLPLYSASISKAADQ